eukprot:2911097-Prymnesium_polylepis.2
MRRQVGVSAPKYGNPNAPSAPPDATLRARPPLQMREPSNPPMLSTQNPISATPPPLATEAT